jgi:Mn2+/Fe2+ NRAMP family transporter
MITLLEPLAGPFAVSIFAIGIIAAGVSSQFPNVLMLPWLLCDYRNSERDMTLPKYRIMVFFISLLGLVVPLFEAKPLFVMIASQALNVAVLPATVACIIYLGNRADLMGKYRHSAVMNVALAAIFLFSLVTSYMGLQGLLGMIAG